MAKPTNQKSSQYKDYEVVIEFTTGMTTMKVNVRSAAEAMIYALSQYERGRKKYIGGNEPHNVFIRK